MTDFYKTLGGRRFIDSTMPRIANALENIATDLRVEREIAKGQSDRYDHVEPLSLSNEERMILSNALESFRIQNDSPEVKALSDRLHLHVMKGLESKDEKNGGLGGTNDRIKSKKNL